MPEDTIFLPMPTLKTDLPSRPQITFNTYANVGQPENFAQIADRESFSRLIDPNGTNDMEIYIKAPGTGFYIPPKYGQMVPAIQQMIDHYYERFGDDGSCYINVIQKLVEPAKDNVSPFIHPHKDTQTELIAQNGQAPNHYICIVSDNLMTGFSDHELSEQDVRRLVAPEADYRTMAKVLGPRVEFNSVAGPYTLTGFDATALHAIANPKRPTFRTMLLANFTGPEWQPDKLNNPALEKVVAALKSSQDKNNQMPSNYNATP